ncbi:MAG: hypothetical protein KKI02_10560, partial [Planctomycetes bacterium]|nr:hypothetical protein [Planctomycetota bacterium]
ATSPEKAEDAAAADQSDPGYDITYNPATDSYAPVEVEQQESTPPEEATPEEEKTWVEIVLVDEEGEPCAGERYRIVLPDGTIKEGTLDANGKARVSGIDPGSCEVTFPRLDVESWRREG